MRAPGYPGAQTAPAAAPPPERNGGLAAEVHTLERAIFEVKRIIVGQDQLVERMLVGLLAKGHVLLEGVPGVAKTLAVETFAKVVGGTFARIQFTPDLVPTDIVGTRIYRQGKEEFDIELGPVVVNFLLADEINRAPAKVQSALLEVMAGAQDLDRRQDVPAAQPVPGDGHPEPDRAGGRLPAARGAARPLPVQAQRRLPVARGRARDHLPDGRASRRSPSRSSHTGDLLRLQDVAANNFVHHALVDYVVRVVTATRQPEQFGMPDAKAWIAYGASPRASLGIIAASRALALVRGRDYVIPQDVVEVIPDVLRHRLVLTYDALADEISPETVINRILQTVGPAAGECRSAARSFGAARWCPPRRLRLAVGDRCQSAAVGRSTCRRCSAGEIRDPELSAALRKLELTVRRKLDGVLHGDHLGLIPGPGSEPGESRIYQPGDDVRRMDWSVTARTTHPHVRQMIADRELETWLVVDMSASLDFGTTGCEKRDLAVAAAAAITFLNSGGGNRLGAIIANGDTTCVGCRRCRAACTSRSCCAPSRPSPKAPVGRARRSGRRRSTRCAGRSAAAGWR